MTVGDLRDFLEDCDDDAQVYLLTQPNWPFEFEVAGAIQRCELDGPDGDGDEAKPTEDRSGELRPSDVLLVEGTQLRYGEKNAWNVCG